MAVSSEILDTVPGWSFILFKEMFPKRVQEAVVMGCS